METFSQLVGMVHDSLQKRLSELPREPYKEILDRLKGKAAVEGVYIIFDADGKPAYVGTSADIRIRLVAHAKLDGDLVVALLTDNAFQPFEDPAHRCKCGELIVCAVGAEKVPDPEREAAAKRFQKLILSDFRVTILTCETGTLLPLGRRELERLTQYVLAPYIGFMPHPVKGQIRITDHVTLHPVPRTTNKGE